MRMTQFVTPLLPWLLLLGSCSAPPKPPTLDESLRRPANSGQAVELQRCKHELHNSRLEATESGRLAEATAATLASLAAQQRMLAALQEASSGRVLPNSVFTLRFAFGSTRVVVPPGVESILVEEARAAPLVLLRGRTDGASDSPAESRIARERAAAVRAWLTNAGLDPTRIRVTHQPAGDHVADNGSATGRILNRRVEIELYRALPVSMPLAPAPTAANS